MKKKNPLIISGLFVISALVISCGGNGTKSDKTDRSAMAVSTNKGQIFEKLADIIEDYSAKIEEKEEKIKQNTDIDKAFKLSKELQLLTEEKDKKASDCISQSGNPISTAVVQEGGLDSYKISEVIAYQWSGTEKLARIQLKSTVEFLKDFPKSMIYIQLYEESTPTNHWIMLNPPPEAPNHLLAGQTYEFKGPMIPQYLIGVTKLVAKTKEDYAAAKKK